MKTAIQIITPSYYQTRVLAIVSGRGCGREVIAAVPVTKVSSGWMVEYCEYQRVWPTESTALNDAKKVAQRYLDAEKTH